MKRVALIAFTLATSGCALGAVTPDVVDEYVYTGSVDVMDSDEISAPDALDAPADVGADGGTCTGSAVRCGASCVNVGTDPANCGSCGHACPSGQVCASGTCMLTCSPGTAPCAGACVSLQTDPHNCGSCGLACPAGQSCAAGTCTPVCAAGTTLCGTTCANLQSDTAHCGSCSTSCAVGAHASAACSSGACQLACDPGFADCDHVAANGCEVQTASDASNCGACGTACRTGVCQSGACVGFGGGYEAGATSCAWCDADPLSGSCSCASGTAGTTFDVVNDCGGARSAAHLVVCNTSTASSAYGGAYEQDDATPGGIGCRHADPYTGGCSCASGTSALTMRVIVVGSTGGLIGSNLTVCLPPAPVGSLGGFYEIDDPVPGNDGCRVSNPFTGGCSCPGGYSAGQLRTLVDIAGSALIGAHIVQCTR